MSNDKIVINFQSGQLIFCAGSLALYEKFAPYWMVNEKGGKKYLYCSHETFKNKPFHRMLMKPAEGLVVDHINGNSLDNRLSNLRLATPRQNAQNSKIRKHNKSGYKGVSFCKCTGKWVARIKVSGVYLNLGRFDTPELASAAYIKCADQFFGAFACYGNPT
jgi:hypothetical protein